MGGWGSGRTSQHATVEHCRSLDIHKLKKAGALAEGWSGAWQWTVEQQTIAAIKIIGGREQITLAYKCRRDGENWKDVRQAIRISWSSCRFGGNRPYFVCPALVDGATCAQRVTKLYAAGSYFFCRHCQQLKYSSCSETPSDRTLRRANKIRMQLGGEPGLASDFPARPKGMWHSTYDRLRMQACEAELSAIDALEDRFAKLLASSEAAPIRSNRKQRAFWS